MTEDPFRNTGVLSTEEQKIFNERSSIALAVMEKGANVMLSHIRFLYEGGSKSSPVNILSRNIEGLLRIRMSPEQADSLLAGFSSNQRKIFQDLMELVKKMLNEKLGLTGSRGSGESFWEVEDPTIERNPYSINTQETTRQEVKIQPKEYFTFVPMYSEASYLLEEISRFYNALHKAIARVQTLAREQNLDIVFKFKDEIKELLMDLDSVVVYVPNQEVGREVRKIIDEEMKKQNVRMGQGGRARSGFDMRIGNEEFSHRQLIARVVGKKFHEKYKLSPEDIESDGYELSENILKESDRAGKLTPEQVLRSIE